MGTLFFGIGMLAFFVGLIFLIVNIFRKKNKWIPVVISAAGIVLFVVTILVQTNQFTADQIKQVKENATRADYDYLTSSAAEKGVPVFLQGEVTAVNKGGEGRLFRVMTKDADTYVFQNQKNTTNTEPKKGEQVTVYGKFVGVGELQFPHIVAWIIK